VPIVHTECAEIVKLQTPRQLGMLLGFNPDTLDIENTPVARWTLILTTVERCSASFITKGVGIVTP
jgi:hypothetical protein